MSNYYKKLISRIMVFIFVFVQLTVSLSNVYGEESNSTYEDPSKALSITIGDIVYQDVIDGQTIWFKFNPDAYVGKQTHISFEVTGVNNEITFYSNYNNAIDNKTNKGYVNKNDLIDIPIAWEGTYYIKVNSHGNGNMNIKSSVSKREPSLPDYADSFCTAEALATSNTSMRSLLPTLRKFRDNVLNNSDTGRDITKLYYETSLEISGDILFNSKLRSSLSKDISNISGLMGELKNISDDKDSKYILSSNDYKSLLEIKNLITPNVDEEVKIKIDKMWDELDIENMVGKDLDTILNIYGLDSNKFYNNEVIVTDKTVSSINDMEEKVEDVLAKKGLNTDVSIEEAENSKVKLDDTYIIKFDDLNVTPDLLKSIKNIEGFKNTSQNYETYSLDNDVSYEKQWNLENKGQQIPNKTSNSEEYIVGTKGSDINYINMKKLLNGKNIPKTSIAVIDTGVNYELADFSGVIDYKNGYDFINEDNDAMDDNDHGTHVAGIIGARNNNGYSISGINSNTTILPIKALDEKGGGSTEKLGLAIEYAVNKGAKVINLSLGIRKEDGSPVLPSEVPFIEEKLKYAKDKGVTVVVAAGNEEMGNLSYPANSSYVISVGATNNKDNLATFSNYGKGLDIVAPGVSIPSLIANGETAYLSGTSMSTPHVTAIAGLIYSLSPSVTPDKVRDIFHKSSKDLGARGYDTKFGYGRLDTAKVIDLLMPKVTKVTLPSSKTVILGKSIKLNATILPSNATNKTLKWTSSNSKIATVDQYGNVYSKGVGKVVIKAESMDGSKKYSSCNINVISDIIVSKVTNKSSYITGTAQSDTNIEIKVKEKVIGTAKSSSTGTFNIKIPTQGLWTKISVVSKDSSGKIIKTKTITVTR